MAERTPRPAHGRRFDVLATILIGAVVTGAALIPAITANAGGTTTIRGDVALSGQRLAFFPVGFWAPGSGVVSETTTDSNGVFTLDVPQNLDGYAFAGTAPDARSAIFESDGQQVERAIIGGEAQTGVQTPLYQGWDGAVGRSLARGADQLHFRMQEAGRISGTSPLTGSELRAVQVRRLDGSVVQTLALDAQGRFTSRFLAPGTYAVAVVPRAPLLPTAVQVVVQPGRTATASPPSPVFGGAIDGTVETAPRDPAGGVPVLLEQEGVLVASTTSDATGRYRFTGLPAGDYAVVAGRYALERPTQVAASAVAVPIPGRTATPGPGPTPTATTPTPSPGPSQQVLEPVQRVSGTVRPATTAVTIPAALGTVTATTQVDPAGRISGRVDGASGAPVRVVVEDEDGAVIASATAATDGAYSVGGLEPGGRYTVRAVTQPDDPTLARAGSTTGLATTATTGVDVVIDQDAVTLTGTVAGATSGTVVVGDANGLLRSGRIDASGAYAVQGLVPGLYPVVVRAGQRVVADPVAVDLPADAAVDLQPGPEPAVYRGWFISGGAGVPVVTGTATSSTDDTAVLGPDTDDGHLTASGLRPGTYTYDADSFAGTVPVVDGPWWFDAPTGTFALSGGATTDVGPVVLHLRAR